MFKTTKIAKILLTGAGGNISYALLPSILSGRMLGADVKFDLILLDLPHMQQNLRGIEMEILDCASPLVNSVVCTDDIEKAAKGIDIALLIGASPRTANMTRSDLLAKNGLIFTAIGQALDVNAAEDVKILVVGNPCNTNALITLAATQNIPKENFFAMTMLDQNRATAQLAAKTGMPIEIVSEMFVWGNHSLTQYPDFYNAKIDGIPAIEVIEDISWFTDEFSTTNRGRGKAVIEARGASSAFSAAEAIVDTVHGITGQATKPISVATYSTGEHYGIPEGIMFSTPWLNSVGVVEGIEHNEFSQQQIQTSILELLDEKEAAINLGFIPQEQTGPEFA